MAPAALLELEARVYFHCTALWYDLYAYLGILATIPTTAACLRVLLARALLHVHVLSDTSRSSISRLLALAVVPSAQGCCVP